jgi:hypothetical protein
MSKVRVAMTSILQHAGDAAHSERQAARWITEASHRRLRQVSREPCVPIQNYQGRYDLCTSMHPQPAWPCRRLEQAQISVGEPAQRTEQASRSGRTSCGVSEIRPRAACLPRGCSRRGPRVEQRAWTDATSRVRPRPSEGPEKCGRKKVKC